MNTAPKTYAIRVDGHLDDHWSAWLGELGMTRNDDGTTTITALIADQAQLHGLFTGLRDIGAVITELRTTDAPVSAAKPSQTSTSWVRARQATETSYARQVRPAPVSSRGRDPDPRLLRNPCAEEVATPRRQMLVALPKRERQDPESRGRVSPKPSAVGDDCCISVRLV